MKIWTCSPAARMGDNSKFNIGRDKPCIIQASTWFSVTMSSWRRQTLSPLTHGEVDIVQCQSRSCFSSTLNPRMLLLGSNKNYKSILGHLWPCCQQQVSCSSTPNIPVKLATKFNHKFDGRNLNFDYFPLQMIAGTMLPLTPARVEAAFFGDLSEYLF